VFAELSRLRAELGATIDAHRPAPSNNGEPDGNAPDAEAAPQS
jgi:hypothetical protein